MSPDDLYLLSAVFKGNLSAVKAALEAGANVNGSPGQFLVPIAAAAVVGNANMVKFLLGLKRQILTGLSLWRCHAQNRPLVPSLLVNGPCI